MKIATGCLLAAVALSGCMLFHEYALEGDPSEPVSANPGDLVQPGFFFLRYQAYKGTNELGGTLNEIEIKNVSTTPLEVVSVSLDTIYKGRHLTDVTHPIHYLEPGVFQGFKVKGSVISPGGSMYFVFPTENITEFSEGDRMKMKLGIHLRAGKQEYSHDFRFTKTIRKQSLAWP